MIKNIVAIARCTDHRYWTHGDTWSIKLVVGDDYSGGRLPITYCLESEENYEMSKIQSIDLIKNINHHLKHEAFLAGYEINREVFRTNYIALKRKQKLEEIKLQQLTQELKENIW